MCRSIPRASNNDAPRLRLRGTKIQTASRCCSRCAAFRESPAAGLLDRFAGTRHLNKPSIRHRAAKPRPSPKTIHPTRDKPPSPPHLLASQPPQRNLRRPRARASSRSPVLASDAVPSPFPQWKGKYNSREFSHARDRAPSPSSTKSPHPWPRSKPRAPLRATRPKHRTDIHDRAASSPSKFRQRRARHQECSRSD